MCLKALVKLFLDKSARQTRSAWMGSSGGHACAHAHHSPCPLTVGETSLVDEAALHNFFFSRCGAIQGIRMLVGLGACHPS